MIAIPPDISPSAPAASHGRNRSRSARSRPELAGAAGDLVGVAAAVDDRRVILRDNDLAGPAEEFQSRGFKADAGGFADDLATGQDRPDRRAWPYVARRNRVL